MSGPTAADNGAEDVNDFLQRIKELGDRRDQEDEERNRKLEEEILQGRKERQARRAERARSISPTKSSPANTPTTSRISEVKTSALSQSQSPISSEPRRDAGVDDAMDKLTGSSNSPTKENVAPFDTERIVTESDLSRSISVKSPSNAMPSRSSTLSWQRRPHSRTNSQSPERPRSRTLSMVAAENAARSPRATPEAPSAPEPILSREEIAQSLASKDPAWFRQTADRGLNSKAYRRNQVEDEDRSDHGVSLARVQMPGMAKGPSEPERAMDDREDRSSSPFRSSAGYGSGARASYQASSRTSGGIGSPLPLTPAQVLDPPGAADSDGRSMAMSPSQGRISPERLDRPASPTKGMGGFVQSAIMKRSDSVKRWSVQSPPGLARGDSIASNRTSQDRSSITASGVAANSTAGVSRPSSLSRDASPRPNSRPTSSHSNATITQERPGTSSSMRSSMTASTASEVFIKPTLPSSRTQTPLGNRGSHGDASEIPTEAETTPPTSPSKTMDPRRWSPTKSSWLESALNKPESPKPKPTPPPQQQPAWMSEINKAKQKSGADLARSPTASAPKHEVSIGGLMRSPPPGGLAKPLSVGGLPAGFSSGAVTRNRMDSVSSQDSKDSSKPNEPFNIGSSTPTASRPSPTIGKIKPETPPKKDFRANLKSRDVPTQTSSNEPEFKNVFGQLRRTKTQNYVAPDELKSNITRGKAALNVTGGPKKTERTDEFKDAILKKKEDFKKAQLEGKGITRFGSTASQDADVPEALAKRMALGRSGSITADANPQASGLPLRERRVEAPPKSATLLKETSAPGRLQAKEAVGAKLAGRLNPGLAGILARGPPSTASETSRSSTPNSQRTVSMSTSNSNPEAPESGPQLTHMTKGRARGPRRKAPTSVPAAATTSDETNSTASRGESMNSPSKVETKMPEPVATKQPAADSVSQPSSPRKLDIKRRSQFLQEAPDLSNRAETKLDTPKPLSPTKANFRETPVKLPEPKPEPAVTSSPKSKPTAPVKSPSLTYREKPKVDSPAPCPEIAKNRPPPLAFAKPDEPGATPRTPRQSGTGPEVDNKESAASVKNAAALWGQTSPTRPTELQPRIRSPIKLPTQADEKAAMAGAGLRPASPVKGGSVGLGIQNTRNATTRPLPTPSTRGPISPPSSAGLGPPMSPTKSNDSPVPQTSEASRLLAEFFGRNRSSVSYKVDTAAMLGSRPDQGENIKTLRSSLYQLTPDGKKQQVPSHQERILFEGNLYLCLHTFGNAAGKKVTEMYYWLGDSVSTEKVKEVEVFAQKEAKSAGAKLVTVRQGKESPEFFHALGGIIIIRRGSASKYDSLAPHILCCRKHLGQIVFDEVDFVPSSLCSGFPYLISTKSGKSYLWKGKGSGIEELSCARLIGMDFGITGEIEEVDDGKEPSAFLQIFAGTPWDSSIKSADHWKLKPNYTKYSTRLFHAHSSLKEQISEISPFCIYDLREDSIYILDAFFEVYILVGSLAQAEFAAFQHSLMFAQEYGILAAGMEDRPFVPITTVVMGGVPKDMKAVFRKWKDFLSPTDMKPTGSPLQRGRSLRVVPLTAALEATRN